MGHAFIIQRPAWTTNFKQVKGTENMPINETLDDIAVENC